MSTGQEPVAVLAPLPGRCVALSQVPDPVFSQGLVGGGAAVEPEEGAGRLTAVAPLAGRVVKVMPHAYIIQHPSGAAVLVHVGIDTVDLKGEGFTVHAAKGDQVRAGDPMVEADLALVRARGLSPCCPVVVLDTAPGAVTPVEPGSQVAAGDPLFDLPG